uniref:Uncharacterized protein n=1 Tax=Catagonus wagneri TaxID=51154 RepID=A0A8C3XBQ5_9CETA
LSHTVTQNRINKEKAKLPAFSEAYLNSTDNQSRGSIATKGYCIPSHLKNKKITEHNSSE